jgi:hypothetical protein
VHSLNHADLARTLAAAKLRAGNRPLSAGDDHRAPPLRARAAWVVARAATRLDAESARRAAS